jgi:hypothetical protein
VIIASWAIPLGATMTTSTFTITSIAIGAFIGWGFHLLLDALTPAGIPLPSGQFSWNWAPYNSPSGNRVLALYGSWLVVVSPTVLFSPLCPPFLVLCGTIWVVRWHSGRVAEQDVYWHVTNSKNADIVRDLTAIGVCYERRGEREKAWAYRRAANSIRSLRDTLAIQSTKGSLTSIHGVGRGIAKVIYDTIRAGHCEFLEFLLDFTPGLGQKVPTCLMRKPASIHEETTIAPQAP